MDMEKHKTTPEYRTWRTLFSVSDGIHALILHKYMRTGKDISIKQHVVMKKVCEMTEDRPEGIPLKDLVAALQLTPGTVSELVDNLVRKSVLQRVQNPKDRRAVLITVTEICMERLREAEIKINAIVKRLLQNFSDADKEKLIALLSQLGETLKTF